MGQKKLSEVATLYNRVTFEEVAPLWESARSTFDYKIIVLDDDPTGVQTVHGVSVYTEWSKEMIEQGFKEKSQLFFILTNSRAMTEKETKEVHKTIARRIHTIATEYNIPYIIISRSDSTLRGHYPLETVVLKETIEKESNEKIDGEIIIPYFQEGGRYTVQNIHYVAKEDVLIPAGNTEFAKDRTFGFTSSHLGEWIEEKTAGAFTKEDVTYICLQSLRQLQIDEITKKLMNVTSFNKVVVNALEEVDIFIFSIALIKAMAQGKRFLFRTAATFTKVIGNIYSRPLLKREELMATDSTYGGLVVVGSHVTKTTEQLQALRALSSLHFIEFHCELVLQQEAFAKEIKRVYAEVEKAIAKGVTAVIYTSRTRVDLGEGMHEEELKLSVQISEAITHIVKQLTVRPKYIIAKGGITSSDIGTKSLLVKRATVLGQVAPGVPVWKTGSESLFPSIPYIIFPGNVGEVDTLLQIVSMLENGK